MTAEILYFRYLDSSDNKDMNFRIRKWSFFYPHLKENLDYLALM